MCHPSFPWKVFFSDLVLQLVNFEPLGGAKTDPRGKKNPDHPQAELGMCYM